MRKFLLIFLFSFAQITLAYADGQPAKKQEMSDNFNKWEQENAPREAAEDSKYGELWSKTLLMLVVVLLALFAGTWYLKRFGPMKLKENAKDSRIQIIEKKVISPKAVIYLLSIDGQKVALSETSAGIQVLQELGKPVKPFSLDQTTQK